MKLHRELGYDEQRKPIVFEVSRSKVKVTRTWKIKCCPDDNSRTLGPRIMKLHRELGYGEQRKPIVF